MNTKGLILDSCEFTEKSLLYQLPEQYREAGLSVGKQPKQLSKELDELAQKYRASVLSEGKHEIKPKRGGTGSNKAVEIKKRFDSLAMKLKSAKQNFEFAQKALSQVLDNSDRYSSQTMLKVQNHYNQARNEYKQALNNSKKIN